MFSRSASRHASAVAAPSFASVPTSTIGSARTLPSSAYTSPEFFAREQETVFRKNYLAVGHVGQLGDKIGAYFTGFHFDSPYMVVRTEYDGVKGFHNVCRHHGTLLLAKDGLSPRGQGATGVLSEKCIKCPYHGWTYSLEGKLTKATRMKGSQNFVATNHGLHPIPMQIQGPLVFLQFNTPKRVGDAPIPPECLIPAHPLPQLPEDFSRMVHVLQKEYEIQCNWKVYVDNYLDGGYHVEHAHPDLSGGLDMTQYSTILHPRYSVQACEGKSLVSADGSSKKKDTESEERLGTTARYYYVYPNLMLNRYGRWLDTNRVIPIAVDRCRVVFDYYLERGPDGSTPSLDDPAIQSELAASHRIQLEDEWLCRRVQQGIHSDSFDVGRYAPTVEQGMWHFHELLKNDMQQ